MMMHGLAIVNPHSLAELLQDIMNSVSTHLKQVERYVRPQVNT